MSRLMKFIGAQFGLYGPDDKSADDIPAVPVDPDARRLAEAEINGSLVIEERRGTLPRDYNAPVTSIYTGSPTGAVARDGSIDFDLFFSKINLPDDQFTADQAIRIVENVEATIPSSIVDPKERSALIRNVLRGMMSGPAPEARLVNNAKVRADALAGFVRQRILAAAESKQRAAQRIQELEAQIAKAENQLSTLSTACNERQAKYNALIDLLSATDDTTSK